jgi:hypothetical protein
VIGFNRGGIPTEISVANQGSFSARWTGRHLLEEIGLRVVRYLWEKCDLKLPPSPKCANVGFLDKILCVLVMLDNPARCIPDGE